MSPDWIIAAWLCGAVAADGGLAECRERRLGGAFITQSDCNNSLKHALVRGNVQIAVCVPKDKAPAGEAAR